MDSIKVIKIGGNIVDSPELADRFAKDFASLQGPRILVHGGGVMASRMQEALGQKPVMIEGRRVTDEDTLKTVTMVYAGWCSKKMTALLQKYGCDAIGLCGADAGIIRATKRPPVPVKDACGNPVIENGVPVTVDYGFAGDVRPQDIRTGFLLGAVGGGMTPVICAITHDGNGNLLNTNADTIASSVASALAAAGVSVSLVYCFEKDGVLYDRNDDSSVIPEITPESYACLKKEGRVAAGMIPKLDNSFSAIAAGVKEVIIKNSLDLHGDSGTRLTAGK